MKIGKNTEYFEQKRENESSDKFLVWKYQEEALELVWEKVSSSSLAYIGELTGVNNAKAN